MPASFKPFETIINSHDWVPLIADVGCDTFVIDNLQGPDDVLLSADGEDASPAIRIYAGNQWGLTANPVRGAMWSGLVWGNRHKPGETLGYVKSVTQNGRTLKWTVEWS